jgi:hypothetical protein
MSQGHTQNIINQVSKIFIDAGVKTVPSYKEIREELEIIDEIYITNDLIERIEYCIADYLDGICPKYTHNGRGHVQDMVIIWNNRRYGTHEYYVDDN